VSQESPEKKGKDLFAKIGQTLRSSAETLVQETRELTRVGKLKMELLSLENERGRKFEEIGRLTHTLYRGGVELPDDLKEPLLAVDEIEAKIDAKKQETDRLRKEEEKRGRYEVAPQPIDDDVTLPPVEPEVMNYCSQCGARLGDADRFCSKCGSPVSK